jgi:hypothetical protein
MSSNPSGVSLECTAPDSAQRKIVREFTWAKIAASSTFNISTWREQAAHQAALRRRLTTTHLSVSTMISVRVFIEGFPVNCTAGGGQYRRRYQLVDCLLYSLQLLLNNLG